MRGVVRTAGRVGAVLLLLLAIAVRPAGAAMTTYYRAGNWHAFSGVDAQGKLVCGIGADDPMAASSLDLRVVIGGPQQLSFRASKLTWNIPRDTPIPIVMQMPGTVPWALQATGHDHEVDWVLDADQLAQFDTAFRAASDMTISFPSGNESPWQVSLAGSTAADNTFRICIDDLTGRMNAAHAASAQATRQSGPTQPYGAPTTQPFAPRVTAAPLQSPAETSQPAPTQTPTDQAGAPGAAPPSR